MSKPYAALPIEIDLSYLFLDKVTEVQSELACRKAKNMKNGFFFYVILKPFEAKIVNTIN